MLIVNSGGTREAGRCVRGEAVGAERNRRLRVAMMRLAPRLAMIAGMVRGARRLR
jgi:hypothetical protein